MKIFDFSNYREFLFYKLKSDNRSGKFHNLARKLAIQRSFVSQVLNGKKNLSLELAADICLYLKLDTLETNYFLLLVQIERAKTEHLKEIFKKQLADLRRTHSHANSFRSVDGYKWEFQAINPSNGIEIVVEVDLTQPKTMIATVTGKFGEEIVKACTRGPVEIIGDKIINNQTSREQKYFSDGHHWCSAEIPSRVMTYQIIDDFHISVKGDPFHPAGLIWTRKQ